MPSFTDKFSNEDSFAYWPVPAEADLSTQTARNIAFKEAYQPDLPADVRAELAKLTDAEWQVRMAAVKYVLVGLNPGNMGTAGNFSNFHGNPISKDYNLAAVLYGTDVWGAFMTDLSQTVESDSSDVRITEADVKALYQHLDNLGIPKTAKVIAMHSKVRSAMGKKAAQAIRPFDADVQFIYHYSYKMHSAEEYSQKSRDLLEALAK